MGLLHMHDLPTLQEDRERLRLTFMYKMVEGLVPAVPADTVLTPRKGGRQIRSSRSTDFVSNNPVENYVWNNDRSYPVPHCNTEQYKHFFPPRTIIALNHFQGDVAQLVEHRKGTPPTQVRFPGAARDFSPRVSLQCRLSRCPYTPVRNRMHWHLCAR